MVNTKWDTSELTNLIRRLDNNRQTLERNKDFLMNINKEVENAWQGYAGKSFDKRMEIDAKNIENVISGIETLIEDLKNVVNQCYEHCEEAVKTEIASMRNKI